MFKKASLLGLSFLLAFYPAAVLAAETEEQQSNEQIDNQVDVTTENSADNEEENVAAESTEGDNLSDSESTELPAETTADTESVTDEEAIQQDGDTEVTNTDDSTDTNEEISDEDTESTAINEDATSENTDNNDETSSDEDTDSEESLNEEEKTEDEASEQLDEDLDLTDIYGTINQREDLQFDFNKGYYVLDLQAGLGNYSRNQVLNDKWIAFALPNGVYLASEDVPAGVVPVEVKGKNGVAIKIPDVKEFPDSQYVYPKIPLVGEPDDNDPVLNLYLYNVNVSEQTYEEIGQIKEQREIDFSQMEGTPELDIDSDFTGEATYDSEKGYYVLDLTVNATNNTNSNVSDIYGAFKLPEGVQIVETADSLDGIELLNLDDGGSPAVAVKLPQLGPEEDKEITYQIPLLGQTTENVASTTIKAYLINGEYYEIGQLHGSVTIDLSAMSESWEFSAESQIVGDFPGLEDGQLGLRFAFTSQNLTWDSVDRVKVEFQVPDTITIYEPDSYEQGELPDSLKDFLESDMTTSVDLDLSREGNTAIINLDTVDGAHTFEGWFTAFGETNAALGDLKGLEVLVTLYQNGEEVAQELHVPFDIVDYEGDDDSNDGEQDSDKNPETPVDPVNPDENESPNKDKDENVDEDNSSDNQNQKDNNSSDDQKQKEESPSDESNNQNDDNNQSNDEQDNSKEEQTGSQNVDNDDNSNTSNHSNVESSTGAELPDTATNMYSLLLVGSLLTVAGGALLFIRKRKTVN